MPSIATTQRTVSKTNPRKKSLRNIVKQTIVEQQQISEIHHDEDTLEFTQIENIRHINGLPRV